MTNRDFFYWLQGHFELGAPNTYIDKRQADLILRHAAMVSAPSERLVEVRTFARMLTREPVVETAGAITDEMREVVGAEFLHVLDPQDGGPEVQAKLDAFHKANPHMDPTRPPDPSGRVMRC